LEFKVQEEACWWHDRAAGAMAATRELSQRETVSKFVRYSIAMLAVPLAVFAWMHVFGVSCAWPSHPALPQRFLWIERQMCAATNAIAPRNLLSGP
jgi:hypothetical protein